MKEIDKEILRIERKLARCNLATDLLSSELAAAGFSNSNTFNDRVPKKHGEFVKTVLIC